MGRKIVFNESLRDEVNNEVRKRARSFNRNYDVPVPVSVSKIKIRKDRIELRFEWIDVARKTNAQVQDFLREFLFKEFIQKIEKYLKEKLNWAAVSLTRYGFKVSNRYACVVAPV